MKNLNNLEHNTQVLSELDSLKPIQLKSFRQIEQDKIESPKMLELATGLTIISALFVALLMVGI